jgi:hypothetical protein
MILPTISFFGNNDIFTNLDRPDTLICFLTHLLSPFLMLHRQQGLRLVRVFTMRTNSLHAGLSFISSSVQW